MRRRYTVVDGVLVDRNGHPAPQWGVGKVVGLTLELTPAEGRAAERGTTGGSSSSSSNDNNNNDSPQTPRAEIWTHYVEVFSPRNQTLDPESARIIDAALAVASVDECKRAIDGNKASPFHQGHNEQRKAYHRLSTILKGRRGKETTRERIDFFLDIGDKAGVGASAGPADPVRLQQAKRAVFDAFEYPDDEQVGERGEEAVHWLAQNGWRVERDGERPRFVTS